MRIATGHSRLAGVTLIELALGLALGMLVIAGVLAIFGPAFKGFLETHALGDIQENERFAMHEMNRFLQQGGYTGCDASAPVANVIKTTEEPFKSIGLWAFDFYTRVKGFSADHEENEIKESLEINKDDWLKTDDKTKHVGDIFYVLSGGTETIQVLEHDPIGQEFLLRGDLSPLFPDRKHGYMLIVSDCVQSTLFHISRLSISGGNTSISYAADVSANCKASGDGPVLLGGSNDATCSVANNFSEYRYEKGSLITKYQPVAYYLRRSEKGLPTLYRHPSLSNIAEDEQVISGVENMRVFFGFQTGSGIAYATAKEFETRDGDVDGDGAAETWKDVISLDVYQLLRSGKGAGASPANPKITFPDIVPQPDVAPPSRNSACRSDPGQCLDSSDYLVECTSEYAYACPDFLFPDDPDESPPSRLVLRQVFSIRNRMQ